MDGGVSEHRRNLEKRSIPPVRIRRRALFLFGNLAIRGRVEASCLHSPIHNCGGQPVDSVVMHTIGDVDGLEAGYESHNGKDDHNLRQPLEPGGDRESSGLHGGL